MSPQKYVPVYCKLDDDISFDDSIWKTNLVRRDPTSGKEASALNGTSNITFELETSSIIRLGSPRSGIEIEYEYRTKSGNPLQNDRNANITLSNGAIWYLFNKAKLRFADEDIEDINNLPVVLDIMNQLKGNEFRKYYGEAVGFIPDESDGRARKNPTTGTVTISAADTAANTNAGRPVNLNLNNNYNNGYKRRHDRYNYTIQNDDTFRSNREFHAFSEIFGFCDYYDRILKHIKFAIELERSDKYRNAIFGEANTDMEIRITNIVFQIEEVILDDELKAVVNKRFEITPEKPLLVSFLKRKCESKKSDTTDCDFSFTKFSCPRFVFVAAKRFVNGGHSQITDNYSLYVHADIKEVIISIDDKQYPDKPQNTKFTRNQYSALYHSFLDVCKALGGECAITSKEYKELFPICAIDCSNQPPKLIGSVTNLGISIKRNQVPDNDDDPTNPRELTFYVIVLDEAIYSFDVINKQVKRLRGGLEK